MKANQDLKNHYSKLLGIDFPWVVQDIDLDLKSKKIDIQMLYEIGEGVECPECGTLCKAKDHAEKRTWRHLDTMQFQTLIHAKIPRSDCEVHGVKQIKVPWSESYSRFTLLFTGFAIDVISACGNTTDACKLLGLSWDEVHLIQKKAVERGLKRRQEEEISYLGIDEKSFKKNRQFISVLNDLDNGRVLEVVEGKSKEKAKELLSTLSDTTKKSVKAVAADMAEVFTRSIEENLPNADIVYDKFHAVRYVVDAVQSVWRSENRVEDSLTGTKFLWIKNPENFSEKQKAEFQKIKLHLLKVGRGWQIKEALKKFWDYSYKSSANKYFDHWYFWATHSRLKPIIRAAKVLKNHLPYILTYFDHHITNATSEGINSKIQNIKANARGFRNYENYRIAILFHCGKLQLNP